MCVVVEPFLEDVQFIFCDVSTSYMYFLICSPRDGSLAIQVMITFSMRKLMAYRIGRQLWCKKEGIKGL